MHETFAALLPTQLPHVPIGDVVNTIVTYLENNIGPFFDFVTIVVSGTVNGLGTALNFVPPLVMVALFTLLALWVRGWKFALFTLIGFTLIDSVQEFNATMFTLSQVLAATLVAVVIAIPVGILAARNRRVSQIVRPVLDMMQTLPPFVYLIPVLLFFSIGVTPGVVATIVFALPPGVRLTELGIRQVDKEIVEAGEAFGSPSRRILTDIQIPLAMPSIMAGVNQVIMLALSMVVIAGMVGAPGLGSDVYQAVTRVQLGPGVESGLAVVIIAVYLDRLTAVLSDRSPVSRASRQVAPRSFTRRLIGVGSKPGSSDRKAEQTNAR